MASPSSSKRKREMEENALPEMRRRKRKREENALSWMAPPPPSSNPASDDPSFHRYDVFINHRGPDVKATLASGLYQFLKHLGLKVFLDSPELQPGDTFWAKIKHAIHSSLVHIVIFSPRYAESRWSLDELQLMLDTGAKIVPVLYKVKSSDLCDVENGIYAKDFLRFQGNGWYSADKLEQWKKALNDAPSSSAVTFDGDLGNLFKHIMDIVLKEVREARNKFKLEVADHPVGLEEAIQELEAKISIAGSNNGNGKIVGIVGKAGLGKTTLAKAFYNHKHPMFYRSSILLGVGGAHRSKKMRKMQQKLMGDLSMSLPLSSANFPPSGPREGFGVEIKSQLEQWYSKPFIIIDGVDHADQLEVLEVKEFLNHGALVIVTCRDKTVLQSFEMVKIYKMRRLDRMHAKQLFCWHAFQKSHPPKERENLVEHVLDVSDGLPLNLKKLGQVIDSILNDRDAEV